MTRDAGKASASTPHDAGSTRVTGAPREARAAWVRVVQLLLLAVTLAYVYREVSARWSELRAVATDVQVAWGWVLLASIVVLATHASLVQAWRLLLSGWDDAPGFWRSVRIWTIANLGRYLPGKLWSVGALGVLARREGVSGVAAGSAAILGTLLNIGAGFGVVLVGGSRVYDASQPVMRTASLAAGVLFVLGVLLLPRVLPPVVEWIARKRGLPPIGRHVGARVLWSATAINVLSWLGYGVAFELLAHAVTPGIAGGTMAFVTVYTASYLWGFLAFWAPGGIGVREVLLSGMLVALAMGTKGDAWFLVLASRAWITVLEVLPGLVALLLTPGRSRAAARDAG